MESFRRLGQEVLALDYRQIIPKVTTIRLKVVRRVLLPWLVRDYNTYVLQQAEKCEPEILFVVKGSYVVPGTLRALREKGVRTYNYYPDVSAFTHDRYIPAALGQYDRVFTTKSFQIRDLKERLGVERATFVPHGYSPDVHRPFDLTEADRDRCGADVSFIGMHTPKKERIIAGLRRALPDVKLRIWGNLWSRRCRSGELAGSVMGRPVWGWAYSKAIQASRVNLGINSEAVRGASSGDLMSRRSFEIPACGGFMIHERNEEVRSFYEEDREVVLFDGVEELAEKVRYYLEHQRERQAIAEAGHMRCVPAYSCDGRMRECLRLHEEMVAGT
jgi:glycosyltransferase involved in cell wall biosynthesis